MLVKPTPRPGSGSDHITNKPYDEDHVPGINTDDTTGEPLITIMKPYDYGVPSLYAGQTVSAEGIYCLLDTYVIGSDMVTYYWDADAYDKYVRVTGISYDNGKTWIKDFPVTLPEDVSDLNVVIRTEYRFSQKSAWREYLVPYTVEQVRFFLLSEQIKKKTPPSIRLPSLTKTSTRRSVPKKTCSLIRKRSSALMPWFPWTSFSRAGWSTASLYRGSTP